MNKNIVLDEEGLICSGCGRDIWHCLCKEDKMKETGIIMAGNHPKLILDGIKTMTRRVIKPQPIPTEYSGDLVWKQRVRDLAGILLECPYGQVGNRLWVRETWAIKGCGKGVKVDKETWADGYPLERLQYIATDEPPIPNYWWNKRPSIFMPRWASRITLEITEVRVERLNEITEEDAIAEGVMLVLNDTKGFKGTFKDLWDSLNAKRGYGWEVNPWVWVISFKRQEQVKEQVNNG